jgi:hypothetical protein
MVGIAKPAIRNRIMGFFARLGRHLALSDAQRAISGLVKLDAIGFPFSDRVGISAVRNLKRAAACEDLEF